MKEVQSLWIGGKLSNLEILCINSFLKNNINFKLYCYQEIENLPQGVIIADGREILPESEIFCYQTGKGKGSFSAFSNIFRYYMLYLKGGIWVDMDLICVKNLESSNDYMFACEQSNTGTNVASCFIMCPPKSDIMKYCYEKSVKFDRQTLEWSVIGPKLLSQGIDKFKLNKYIKGYQKFCPIKFKDWKKIIEPNQNFNFENTVAIHFWNEKWRRGGVDKNDSFESTTLYSQLKNKYCN